jgi:tetratricopeptide (TPR) repeat protein
MADAHPAADSKPDPEDRRPEVHYVLTLHGIRTHGQWQERLGALLRGAESSVEVRHFKYGVFSLISYAVPLLRMINVWRFRRYLERLARKHPGARVDIVAHSFGTFIVGHSLKKIAPELGLRVNTVILSGSVLKVWFPWDELIENGLVRRVVNECGTNDDILVVTQLGILFTGMAGRIGFSGILHDSFKNRFYEFGHSGYFEPYGEDEGPEADRASAFMRQRWVPLLTTDEPVPDHDPRKVRILTPLEHFLLDKADPIKLLAYGAILFATVWYAVLSPRWERAIAEQDRAIAEAHATIAEQEATIQRTKADRARERADTNTERAFQAMHAFGDVVSGDANLQTRADLAPTRKKLLETARQLFKDMVGNFDPGSDTGENAKREFAKARIEIAQLTSDIGGLNTENVTLAIDHFAKAIEILDGLDQGDLETRWARAQAYSGLGVAYLNQQKMEGGSKTSLAIDPLKRALEILEDSGPEGVRASGEDYTRLMAWTLIDLGVLEHEKAAEYYERAEKFLRGSNLTSATAEIEATDDYGWLLINRAKFQERNDPEGARASLSRAREIFDKLLKGGEPTPTHIESLAWSLHDLGMVEREMGRKDEALADLRKARERFEELDRPVYEDRGDRYKLGLASTYKDLGRATRSLYEPPDEGKLEEIRGHWENALKTFDRLSKAKQKEPDVLNSRSWVEHDLGWVLKDLHERRRDGPKAEALLTASRSHFEEAYLCNRKEPAFASGKAWGLIALGKWQQGHQAVDEARRSYGEARALLERVRAEGPPTDPVAKRAPEGIDECDKLLKAIGPVKKASAARVRPVIRKAILQAPADVKIELGRRIVLARATGTKEPPVPVFRDGKPLRPDAAGRPDRFKIVEVYENASTAGDVPLIWADLVSIGYFRSAYQKPEGPGAQMGTSVVGTPSFRPAKEPLKLIPQVDRADITVDGPDRLTIRLAARYGARADVDVSRSYPPAAVGRSAMDFTVRFVAREPIALERDLRGLDAFRLVTLSSMFASADQYDANVLRYEERGGAVRTLRIDRSTRRNAHLLPRGVELGSWLELIKTPGSRWFPDSPSIRLEFPRRSRVPGRLGVQGYLLDSENPNDDSLSVWVEWLDAPEVLAPGTTLELEARVIATPPA